MRLRHGAIVAIGTAIVAAAVPYAASAGTTQAGANTERVCAKPGQAGQMSCFAVRRKDVIRRQGFSPRITPAGYGPADLQSAYRLPVGNPGATVAIVDAYDDPTAESDLAVYRSQFGLSACTTANGCFRKINENGQTSPLPAADPGWAGEISLDVDMVSAACPGCRILLVEASSSYGSDMFAAINQAVAQGARFVSNSWGSDEYSSETLVDQSYLNHPGVAITASAGDNGWGAEFPASSRYVTAVGGTSLTRSGTARGWTESAWNGSGSGCSAYESKPTWQTVSTTCTGRGEADVSAVADPYTGVAVYQTYGDTGWTVCGGTSASAPIVAAAYALAGTPGAADYPASYPYSRAGNLFDVTTGTNGGCGVPICGARTGWDGPTGLGTPNGVSAFGTGAGWRTGSETLPPVPRPPGVERPPPSRPGPPASG